ncbi:MAG: hypothetical protein ACPL1F_01720 [bacterium]
MKKNVLIFFLGILVVLLIKIDNFAGILPIPKGIPQKVKEKLKNYNYYQSALEPGKYVIVVLYSIYDLPKKSKNLKNKEIEIGLIPDLKNLQNSSLNFYKIFNKIPLQGETKNIETYFITDQNPTKFEALPFSLSFIISNKSDRVIINSNLDNKYIMIFKHKEKDEYLVFFDLDFDNNFSDLILLLVYMGPCSASGGGRGGSSGNEPF